MEHKLATAEKKVLVELVKLVQKRGLKGENGGWKEFLDVYDKKFGASLSDPAKRSNDVLVAFLKTFTREDDLKLFARVLQCNSNWDLIEEFKQESPDKESPEQRLVRLTVEHPEYALDYTFPSYSENWFVTKLGKKSRVMKSTEMIAVDCEMVLCEDGTEAVVRVGVVDRKLKVKLDALVNPNKPVADYRTDITGVSAGDIEKATRTVADIQKFMRRLLSYGTILVGHSLNNDLQVLKIDHARVIDTSLIFKYPVARKNRRPSLNNLCKSVLGYEVRKDGAPHDCIQDASAAMKLVLSVVEQGADTTISMTKDVLEIEKTKLFLHRIPHIVPVEELHRVLSGDFTLEIKPFKKPGGCYCAVAVFKTPEEASQTFQNVDGNLEKDSSGLPQKLVIFKLESGSDVSLYVRKMVPDDSLGQISSKKRGCPDEDVGESKKQKTDGKSEETVETYTDQCNGNASEKPMASEETESKTKENGTKCEDHLNEIESLKQQIKNKDFQLAMQDKIISDLRKRLDGKKKAQ